MKFPQSLIDTFSNKSILDLDSNLTNIINKKTIKYENKEIVKVKRIYKDKKNIIQLIINNSNINLLYVNNPNICLFECKINEFIDLLKSFNCTNEIIKCFLFFFWGDYTLNNKGKNRYSVKYLYEKHKDMLIKLNNYLNQKDLKEKLIDYVIFSSKKITSKISGVIININGKYKVIEKEKIINRLLRESINYNNNCISKLIINNKKRNIDFDVKSESKRMFVNICFYNAIQYLQNIIVEED